MSRQDTGKTSRVTITLRILLAITPIPVLFHWFNWQEYGWQCWKLYFGCYGAALFVVFVIWAFTNTCVYFMYRNDPAWQHGRRSGGDTFFDCLLLFNWDSWESRCASPMLVCPACGAALPAGNCQRCGVSFDGKQFVQQPRG